MVKMQQEIKQYWVYRNITTFIASLIFAFFLFQTEIIREFIVGLGSLGYAGALIVGIFFPSSFTVAPSTAALILLSGELNFFWVAIAAGAGAAIGDFFIFRFIRDGLSADLSRLFAGAGNGNILRLFRSKYFGAFTPVLGAIIIASPFPDEFGIGLMGISGMESSRFILMSFVLNAVGIALLLSGINFFFR